MFQVFVPLHSSVTLSLGVPALTPPQSGSISKTGSSDPILWWPSNNSKKEIGDRRRCFTESTYTLHSTNSFLSRNSYTWVRDWSELAQVFRKSFTDSAMDELILLLHSKSPRPHGWRANFARLVVYDRLEDILSGVAFRTSKQVVEPTLPHPGQPMAVVVDKVHENHDGTHEQDIPLENVADDDHEQDSESQEDHEVQTPELQAKNDAARRIQAACTRHLERKKAVPTGIHAIRARFWGQLQTRAAGMTWSHPSRYRLILQGPMVHVLVCLDLLGAAADSAKREVKERAKVAHHEELEELMESQKRYRLGPSHPPLSGSQSFPPTRLADSSNR